MALLGENRIRTVTVIPQTPNGDREAWSFDVVTEMNENLPGQAFRHALQNGEEGITDSTRLEPEEFTVTGIVSETPIRFLNPRNTGATALYAQIKAIRARQVPLTIVTSWAGMLTDRWIEVIQGTHGAGQGASIQIALNFVQFRIVFTQLVPSQVDSDTLLLGSQQTTAHNFQSG